MGVNHVSPFLVFSQHELMWCQAHNTSAVSHWHAIIVEITELIVNELEPGGVSAVGKEKL